MRNARYREVAVQLDAEGRTVRLRGRLENRSGETWRRDDGFAVGWQLFDPETGMFIAEGQWTALEADVPQGGSAPLDLEVKLPAERGGYRLYISPRSEAHGWFYMQGWPMLVVDASVEQRRARLVRWVVATAGKLRRERLHLSLEKALTYPALTVWRNRGLIRSMVRRDILGRYRGSFGDALWTVLNPLLLMLTYFFVFGIVLQARFGADPSRSGFVLYFLAGMLPWLAFSEAAARAPHVVIEHRNFVKKLVFPVEILPVNQAIAGLVTEAFALGVFVAFLVAARGGVPATVLWLPVLVIPQLLFTLGVAWTLAALGPFVRDLGQVIGFALTLWFFVTPICYPEASLPQWALPVLGKNPMFALVRGYRAIFLEARAPEFAALWKLWVVGTAAYLAGHALFYKLRRSFADLV